MFQEPNYFNFPQDSVSILSNYFLNLFTNIVDVGFKILTGLLIFILGWIIALFLKFILESFLSKIKFENFFKSTGLEKYFKNFEWDDDIARIFSQLVFWLVIVAFLMTSLDIMGLRIVNNFIYKAVNYLPSAISGGLILLLGFVFGDLVRKIMLGFLRGLERKNAQAVSSFIKWSIIVFAFAVALSQWGIAPEIINTLVLGLVLFLALAGGLAFGLGGQEIAKEILEDLRRQLR